MADKQSANAHSSRFVLNAPKKSMAKDIESLQRERRRSRKEFDWELTHHPVRDRAAEEACEHLKAQFETTLAALLDIEPPTSADRKLRSGPSKMGIMLQEDASELPGCSIQKKTIDDILAGLPGPAKKTSFSLSFGPSVSSRPSLAQRPEKSEFVPQSTPTAAAPVMAVDPEILRRNPFAQRLMNVVSAMAQPTGPAAVSKNYKALKSLLDECRLTVRSIKAGTDSSGRMQTRAMKNMAAILPLIRSGQSAEHTSLSPEDALSCGYLRLSKDQVVRLENQLKTRGIDPGIHRHTDLSDVRLFDDKPDNKNMEQMPFYLPATSLQLTGTTVGPPTRKKSTERRGQ